MSDQGRPQFLPPEEPREAAADRPRPLLPGMADENDAATPRRWRLPASPRDRLALLVISLSVVGLLMLGGLLLLHSSPGGPSPVPGSPKAQAPGTDYAALPDPCAAVGPALPKDVRSVSPAHAGDSCGWQLLRTDRSRSLDVDLQLERTDPVLGTSGTVEAARDFADDLAYAADGTRNGGFQRNPERLDGLGDEAFAAQASNLVVSGRTEKTARSYDMGGAQVEVRRRNVVVTVKWRGADYPPSVRGRKKLVGTRLSYTDARRQAVVVAHALLAALR